MFNDELFICDTNVDYLLCATFPMIIRGSVHITLRKRRLKVLKVLKIDGKIAEKILFKLIQNKLSNSEGRGFHKDG